MSRSRSSSLLREGQREGGREGQREGGREGGTVVWIRKRSTEVANEVEEKRRERSKECPERARKSEGGREGKMHRWRRLCVTLSWTLSSSARSFSSSSRAWERKTGGGREGGREGEEVRRREIFRIAKT
jgi:hypothetical protein